MHGVGHDDRELPVGPPGESALDLQVALSLDLEPALDDVARGERPARGQLRDERFELDVMSSCRAHSRSVA